MFQTPWLPEFMFSLNDYGSLKSAYRGKRTVTDHEFISSQ